MNIVYFLSGIFMATFAAASLIFFKLYKASGDRFFKYFGFACFFFSAERIAQLFLNAPYQIVSVEQSESQSFVYLFRMVGFLLILYAIINKNKRKTS